MVNVTTPDAVKKKHTQNASPSTIQLSAKNIFAHFGDFFPNCSKMPQILIGIGYQVRSWDISSAILQITLT
jgi:hypothetical protein